MTVVDESVAVSPQVANTLVRVRILRDLSEIEQVRDTWTQWQRHPNCDFEFYQKVLKTIPGIQRPHVLIAYRGHEPQAMLVGRLENSSVDFSIGYKRIVSFPVRCLTFLHGGYVGNTDAEISSEFVKAIQVALSDREAEIVYFNHLRTEETLYSEISQKLRSFGSVFFGEQHTHRGMTLAWNAEAFRRKLTSKERNNQKRREKRIQEDFKGRARIETYRSPSDIDRMIRDIDEIARKTYQRALGVGFENTPSMRERLQKQAECGWLRAYVLYLNECPCAFWMGDSYAGTFYSGFTGYDSEYAKYAPGMFLLLRGLELLCEENGDGILRTANFGLGDAEWKLIIGDLEWQEAPVYLFPNTPKGKIFYSIHRGSGFLNSFGKRILKQNHSIASVKRAWRRRLSRGKS